jgi:nitrogen regulatory protein PII
MRTPEQVANAVVARVVEKTSLGSPLDGSIWRTSIAEEVKVFQVEFVKAVADQIMKVKGMKAKDRKAFALELDKALGVKS